jgi:hypothetical protein
LSWFKPVCIVFICFDLRYVVCFCVHRPCKGPSSKHSSNEEFSSIDFNKSPLPTSEFFLAECQKYSLPW